MKLLGFGGFIADGLHGKVQHHLKTAAVCFFRNLRRVGMIGENGDS